VRDLELTFPYAPSSDAAPLALDGEGGGPETILRWKSGTEISL